MSDVNPRSAEDRRRWLILGVIGLAQLMVVLDVTVMNIALPSAQGALHFTTVDRQWVVTAYTLTFGSLLLLGGRLADLLGRKVIWFAQLGVHTAYVDGVLGPIILTGIGIGMVIAPSINTGTFGVAPRDAGVASATVTVGQQLGASIGTSLLNTIFASAVTSYITLHIASARVIGRQALTGLALAHGYDTAFWWIAGIFAGGVIVAGALFRSGPLYRKDSQAQQDTGVLAAETEAGPALPA